MHDSANTLDALRRRIARIDGRGKDSPVPGFGFGEMAHLPGLLARGAMHEIVAADAAHAAAATGFAAMLAVRALLPARPLLWLRTERAERRSGALYAPGLADLGLDPDALLIGVFADDLALLRAAADASRCSALSVLVVECWGNPRTLDLTATRRLASAAAQAGVAILLLRLSAEPMPSAADTRWQITSAPSAALPARAPGHPVLGLELLRRKAGPSGQSWMIEWRRDERGFHAGTSAPISGAVLPPAAVRAAAPFPARRLAANA